LMPEVVVGVIFQHSGVLKPPAAIPPSGASKRQGSELEGRAGRTPRLYIPKEGVLRDGRACERSDVDEG
jgi:hypothetical protein